MFTIYGGRSMQYIIPTIVGVLALAIGMLLGVFMRKKIAESKIGSAEEEAVRILDCSFHFLPS